MKKFAIILSTAAVSFLTANQAKAQGCVAIRSTGSNLCTMLHANEDASTDGWQLNIGNRYYKSYKHFIGTDEQKQRVEQNTNVINHQYTMDLSLVRNFNDRWSLLIGAPILANSRSQVNKFTSTRFQTHSYGLGDMRVSVYRWMLDPKKSTKGNFQVGVGLKFATGDYHYQDYFPASATTQELRSVDQSIQLGDGGTGLITEVNGFLNFSSHAGLYENVYYLFNPREQNGVPTFRSNPYEAIMSVPDQYMARLGFNYGFTGSLKNLSASIGGRLEGIPVHDVIGGSEGFRRPGYIVSAEPGLNYSARKVNYYLSVPVALIRNRTQSVADQETTTKTGTYTHGDAAFADYLISVGVNIKL